MSSDLELSDEENIKYQNTVGGECCRKLDLEGNL